jgi:HEAT repeat protein
MTNSNQIKADPRMVASLASSDESVIVTAVNDLRVSGSPVYLPVLAKLLLRTELQEARSAVLTLLGELKDQEAVPVLMEIIDEDTYLPVRKELIAACWQNGLDYSVYLSRFVDLVIENDMDIAFEAFTVIENADQLPDASIREIEIIKINHALKVADALKSYLLRELRGILA